MAMHEPNEDLFKFSLPSPPPHADLPRDPVDAERVLLQRLAAEPDAPEQAMWDLAQFYKRTGRPELAIDQLRLLLGQVPDLERKAHVVLALGQSAEVGGDFDMAARFYREAMSMEPTDSDIWYFIQNNLGYCLNRLGRFAEAEGYCRRAIATNPQRANAHKNLGLSLQGQGNLAEAARSFVAATRANASDPRSLMHFESLLLEHPELGFEFETDLELCRRAVVFAREECERIIRGFNRPGQDERR